MKTFKLWLEPDETFPRLKRLRWGGAEVSVQDVLLTGVHPYVGKNMHLNAMYALFESLNDRDMMPRDLEEQHLCGPLAVPQLVYGIAECFIHRAFGHLEKNLCFVEGMSYLDLLGMAKAHLRETWTPDTVHAIAERAWPVFNDLRQVLKSKDKRIKLSATWDVNGYDLSKVLTLEDFAHHERIVLDRAMPTLNFRDAAWVKSITDDKGRLRLKDRIPEFMLCELYIPDAYAGLSWQGSCRDTVVTLRPDIGGSMDKRRRAKEIAAQWRTDSGEMVFRTTVDRVAEMVERRFVQIAFPGLDYSGRCVQTAAKAVVSRSCVQVFAIGPYARENSNASVLKALLQHYGVSMTGTKPALLAKVARLAAEQYRLHKAELDAYFGANRFVRMAYQVREQGPFPVLEDHEKLRNVLLAMYALKHLRGSAVLDPSHENGAYNEDELALALVTGKVEVQGAFLRAGE